MSLRKRTQAERHLDYWEGCLGWDEGSDFVYIIQGEPGTAIKVGFTEDVPARIASLQTGNPIRLRLLCVLPGPRKLEWHLHQRLKSVRIPGTEWFRPGPEVDAFLEFAHDLAERLVAAHDGSERPPHFAALDPEAFFDGSAVTVKRTTPDPRMSKEEADKIREWRRKVRDA